MADLQPTDPLWPPDGFEEAAREVLACLRRELGYALWMVTRVDEDDWIVLYADDAGYGVSDGDLFRWSDSFCIRMVAQQGPRFAPSSDDVPAYAEAPIGQQISIGSYIGVPLEDEDGLFGTLCAIDPRARPSISDREEALVELAARLLSTVLKLERDIERARWHAASAETAAQTDVLTGIGNRRAWERALEREESRSRRYGDPISVLVIDLDGLKEVNDTIGHAEGDELLQRCASILTAQAREADVVARIGGDEFGMLAPNTHIAEADTIAERVSSALAEQGVRVSVGVAQRHPTRGLAQAVREADERMYAMKHGDVRQTSTNG